MNQTSTTVHLCIPDDQVRHLPRRRRAPDTLPQDVPIPRQGEVVYLSRSSAWQVLVVVHQWETPTFLRVEIWLEYLNSSRHTPSGFALTQ